MYKCIQITDWSSCWDTKAFRRFNGLMFCESVIGIFVFIIRNWLHLFKTTITIIYSRQIPWTVWTSQTTSHDARVSDCFVVHVDGAWLENGSENYWARVLWSYVGSSRLCSHFGKSGETNKNYKLPMVMGVIVTIKGHAKKQQNKIHI